MNDLRIKGRDTSLIRFFLSHPVSFATCIRIACLMLILISPGCRKDYDFGKAKKLVWNPDLALALVNDSITLRNALIKSGTEDHVSIDENGHISILYYYNNDAFRIRPNDLIKLAPVTCSYMHQVTQAEQDILKTADLVIQPVAYTQSIIGNNPEIRIDRLLIREGVIRVNTNHTFDNAGYLTVRITNATKNGLPFSFTIEPFVTGQHQTDIDISGVWFDFSASPNTIRAEVEGVLKKSGKPVAGDKIIADLRISLSKIGWFEGFLGHQTFTQLEDTVRVRVFNNAYALGDIYFVDPQASVTIINSIGIPTEITVEKLVAINNASGATLDIADRLGAGAVFSIPAPSVTATHPAVKTVNYNNANTGNAMDDFYNIKPDYVAFMITAKINPVGTPVNFFSDTSSFYGDIRVKLPLYGHFDHLTLQDTFDMKFDNPEDLERLEFRSDIANGLPLTAEMQVYFTDEAYNKKDSLTGNDRILLKEAPVDPATHLPYPGQYSIKDTTFILDKTRVQNLKNVKKLIVRAVLHSSEEGRVNVKLRADQLIKINFTAKARIRAAIDVNK